MSSYFPWRSYLVTPRLPFLFTTASRPALGTIQPPIQWVPGALSLVVKRLEREANHLPPSNAEVKEYVELYFHSPNTPSWRGAQLKKRTEITLPFFRAAKILGYCNKYFRHLSESVTKTRSAHFGRKSNVSHTSPPLPMGRLYSTKSVHIFPRMRCAMASYLMI
jgi:hypothetical protein